MKKFQEKFGFGDFSEIKYQVSPFRIFSQFMGYQEIAAI
jgi:hypothetical protein